jgi:Tfp pilus assembly protein PilO
MDFRTKALLCGLPFLLSGVFWFGITGPTMSNAQIKDTQLNEKLKEQIDLKKKLLDLKQVQSQKTELSQRIDQLRQAIPKNPDMDLLVMDIEKMVLGSDMDVISVGEPDKDKIKGLNTELEDAAQPPAKNKSATPSTPQSKTTPATPANKSANLPTIKPESGLKQQSMEVKVIGDYTNFVSLVKKLESYQRVIGINQIEIEVPESKDPKDAKSAPMADFKHLNLSFLVTAYYLP